MVLELSKSFTHSCNKNETSSYSEQELKDMMLQMMQKNGIDQSQVQQSQDGVLQVDEQSSLKLHSLMLQAEELGLKMTYTKKTLIEIC